MALIGVIGGSGLYEMQGLDNVREHRVETPSARPPTLSLPASCRVSPSPSWPATVADTG
ncbi:hypothetical protein [Microbulbifer taiwanensis]|uniref:hypothetical protein n=1 Tax=Microbulbifer taiwanensis TaxID=986746 RepID=UPI00360772B5